MSKESILFVCAGNACRSVMAQAFAARLFGDRATVDSAGLRPQTPADAQNAIDTLRFEFGIDASGHIPKDVRTLELDSFTKIVAMDKSIARDLRTITDRADVIVWDIHDPWDDDPLAYARCALTIKQHVAKLAIK